MLTKEQAEKLKELIHSLDCANSDRARTILDARNADRRHAEALAAIENFMTEAQAEPSKSRKVRSDAGTVRKLGLPSAERSGAQQSLSVLQDGKS